MLYCKNAWTAYFKRALILTALLSVLQVYGQVFQVDSIMKNGARDNRINLVYLGDGYRAKELDLYVQNTQTINEEVFRQSPFLEYRRFFNAYAIKVPSKQSGAKHPGNAIDEETSGGQPIADPDNYFQSTFDFGQVHRALYPNNASDIFNILATHLPDYDIIFMVVNSPYYGGAGGSFATTSTNSSAPEVAIHEIGHSFGFLADEYDYLGGGRFETANLTQNSDPSTIRWKNWLGINEIGIYPMQTDPVWYRPHQFCKMQYLGAPFCSVCKEQLVDRIHQLVNMMDGYAPAATSFTLTNTNPLSFSVAVVENNPSTITVNWYLNNSTSPFATAQTSVSIPYHLLKKGENRIRAEVIDHTDLSKAYLPGVGYVNSLTWTVTNPGFQGVTLKDFSGKMDLTKTVLQWEIEQAANLKGFELERSKDGIVFTKVAHIDGKENKTRYTYTDAHPIFPETYYRLKVISRDGTVKQSNTIRLEYPFEKLVYKVYQDIKQHKYQVIFSLAQLHKAVVKVYNAGGVMVFYKDFGNLSKTMRCEVDLSKYPPGIYFMEIYINDHRYTVKLVAE